MISPTILVLTLIVAVLISVPFFVRVIDDVVLNFCRDYHGKATVIGKYHLHPPRAYVGSRVFPAYDSFDHWFVRLRLEGFRESPEEEIEVDEERFDSMFQDDRVEVIYRVRPFSGRIWIWDITPAATTPHNIPDAS